MLITITLGAKNWFKVRRTHHLRQLREHSSTIENTHPNRTANHNLILLVVWLLLHSSNWYPQQPEEKLYRLMSLTQLRGWWSQILLHPLLNLHWWWYLDNNSPSFNCYKSSNCSSSTHWIIFSSIPSIIINSNNKEGAIQVTLGLRVRTTTRTAQCLFILTRILPIRSSTTVTSPRAYHQQGPSLSKGVSAT